MEGSCSKEVIVVSGLPRSGTSLMMQMLHHGGLEVMTDGLRGADLDNPRGYFEFDSVKKLKQCSNWIEEARGKAVKIISQLLFHLPETERYSILWVERDLSEILASQAKMLERIGRKGAPPEKLDGAFRSHLKVVNEWLDAQENVRILRVDYASIVAEPLRQAMRITEFIGRELNAAAMADAVDPALYRNRNESGCPTD